MNQQEIFETLKIELLNKLSLDNKVEKINENHYKIKSTIDYIIKHYDCDNILSLCQNKKELSYCLINNDNPYNHYCPICQKQIYFNGFNYNKTCRNKKCLCQILLNNNDLKNKHQYIIDNYLNGDKEFNYIQIGFIEKYGVWMNSQLQCWKKSQSETWKNKTKEELLERKHKTINTCRKKYGCDFSQQNKIIKEKQSKTWKT